MKTIDIKLNLYEFNELNENIKNKLINEESENIINSNFDFFQEDSIYYLESLIGIEKAKIYYSLTYNQGDGLHFDCNNFLSNEIINRIKKELNTTEKRLFNILINKYNLEIYTKSTNHFYEYATNDDLIINIYNEPTNENLKKLLIKIEKIAKKIYLDICSYLEKEGYTCYEINENQIIDYLSNYYYQIDGTKYEEINEI